MLPHPRIFAGLLAGILLASSAEPIAAQRRRTKNATAATPASNTTTEARPESVVILPESAQPKMDTALINPQPEPKRRRRFEVKMVPAAPPGRSRQEIMYTDSIANRSPRR